jgi:tetratricopeptide (TPR) repeat protein
MKKTSKDILIICSTIVMVLIIGLGYLIFATQRTAQSLQVANVGNKRLFVLTTNADQKQSIEKSWYEEEGQKINLWGRQLEIAGEYEKAQNYEQAEIAYKKAIELSPAKSDQGVARIALADIYEATHQYERSIEQIDWLLSRDLRKDVLDDLRLRKQKMEEILADQTNSASVSS